MYRMQKSTQRKTRLFKDNHEELVPRLCEAMGSIPSTEMRSGPIQCDQSKVLPLAALALWFTKHLALSPYFSSFLHLFL